MAMKNNNLITVVLEGKRGWSRKRKIGASFVKYGNALDYFKCLKDTLDAVYNKEFEIYKRHNDGELDTEETNFKSNGKGYAEWLDEDFKNHYVDKLEFEIRHKNVDESMIDFLREINSYDFICTIYSCEGHGNRGYLWVKVSDRKFNEVLDVFMHLFKKFSTTVEIENGDIYGRTICLRWKHEFYEEIKENILKEFKNIVYNSKEDKENGK